MGVWEIQFLNNDSELIGLKFQWTAVTCILLGLWLFYAECKSSAVANKTGEKKVCPFLDLLFLCKLEIFLGEFAGTVETVKYFFEQSTTK